MSLTVSEHLTRFKFLKNVSIFIEVIIRGTFFFTDRIFLIGSDFEYFM